MSDYTRTEMTSLTEMHARKTSRFVPLTLLFVILLVVFTLFKLPQARITNLIQGYVQAQLDPMGIYLSDRGRDLSILTGFVYRLDHPTLELPDGTRVEMDEMVVRPSLMSLLTGKMGATLTMTQGVSRIEVRGSGAGERIDTHIELENCDLARLGIFSFAGVKGSGHMSGDVRIEGSMKDLLTLTGGVQLKLRKIRLDEQNLSGFQLPTLHVSEGTIDVSIENGKLIAKTVSIGKGAVDDLQLQVTGDVTLNRFLNASVLNLRAVLGLSDKVKQSISLLDSMLASGKQGDGRYAFKLNGTLGSPFPVPDPK